MDNVKKYIRENKGIISVLVIGAILLFILFLYYHFVLDERFVYIDTDHSTMLNYKYGDNEYKPMNITDENMAGLYYNYLKKAMLNNPDTLWDISSESLKERFKSKEKFKKYIKDKVTSKTFNNVMTKYSFDEGSNNKFYILDSEGNEFSINEKAVWDIELSGIN